MSSISGSSSDSLLASSLTTHFLFSHSRTGSYRTMMYLMQKVFDLPTYFVASYVSEQMRKETSFLNEGTRLRPSSCSVYLRGTDISTPRVSSPFPSRQRSKDNSTPRRDSFPARQGSRPCRLRRSFDRQGPYHGVC